MKKCAFVAALAAALSSASYADSVRLDFSADSVLSGSNQITGNGDGLVASLLLVDTGQDEVTATLSNLSLLTSSQFFGELKLNLSPFPRGGSASFSAPISDIKFDQDGINAPGGNRYDVSVDFLTSSAVRLGAGESAVFILTGSGLDARDFVASSTKDGPSALLHVQGVGANANGSGWVSGAVAPVPEPATMAALAIGALGVLRRRKSRTS